MKNTCLLLCLLLINAGLSAQNESKLVIEASSNHTNNNPLIRLRTYNGIELMWIHSDNPANTFLGYNSGVTNNINGGISNTFIGSEGGFSNTTGSNNTAVGYASLYKNQTGTYNTGVGAYALQNTTISQHNTALGYQAGANHNNGWNNTFLGSRTGADQSDLYNIVAIGEGTTVTSVSTAILGNAATVKNGGYQNWSNISDGRFKKNIKDNVVGLDFILRLQPITYNLDVTSLSKALHENQDKEWNEQMKIAIEEKEKMIQNGFIAQDVEQVAIECGYNFSGVEKPKSESDVYSLRYAEFVVPLVKSVQELNRRLNEENQLLASRLEKLEHLLGLSDNSIKSVAFTKPFSN